MENKTVYLAMYEVVDRALSGVMYRAVNWAVNGAVLGDFQLTVIRIVNLAVYRARIEDPPHPGLERYLAVYESRIEDPPHQRLRRYLAAVVRW